MEVETTGEFAANVEMSGQMTIDPKLMAHFASFMVEVSRDYYYQLEA